MSRRTALPGLAAILLVVSVCGPSSGQSVGDAALREQQRRARAAGGSSGVPAKTPMEEGLRGQAGQAGPEPASSPDVAPAPSASGRVSRAAFLRHVASAEAYLDRCERGLDQARERWLSATEANEPRPLEEARRELEAAERELERARAYLDEAQRAARRAGIEPGAE